MGRDSKAQRLGVMMFGGQAVSAGAIILRQRGTKFHPGVNVGRGNDDTLYALKTGTVEFREKRVVAFNSNREKRMFVSVDTTSNLKPQTSKVHLKN